MADKISQERRSWNMSRIRGKNTTPECQLRSMLHKAGYRFRLHSAELPGRPDIVLKKHKTVIFVNGCYWHRHSGCKKATTPSTHAEFWQSKFQATVERDACNAAELTAKGWRVITVWECYLKLQPQVVLGQIMAQIAGGDDGT